jgi:hypothetical protein
MEMAMIRITLAVIMVLILGVLPCVGTSKAADTVYPVVAFSDFWGRASMGYLLGASAAGKWIQPEAAVTLIPGEEQYRLYTLAGEVGTSIGGKPAKGLKDAEWIDTIFVNLGSLPKGIRILVGVSGPWNPVPRPVTVGSTEQQIYQEAAAEILKSKGIENPKVILTQVLRVDLDGDGEEEVLVSATNYNRLQFMREPSPRSNLPTSIRAGDYSVVFLRKVVQGKVVTSIIKGEYYRQAKKFGGATEHKVIGVLDLNGDGIMEIVLSHQHYEGESINIYRVKGTKITLLSGMGFGV